MKMSFILLEISWQQFLTNNKSHCWICGHTVLTLKPNQLPAGLTYGVFFCVILLLFFKKWKLNKAILVAYFHSAKYGKLLQQHLFHPVWYLLSNDLRRNSKQNWCHWWPIFRRWKSCSLPPWSLSLSSNRPLCLLTLPWFNLSSPYHHTQTCQRENLPFTGEQHALHHLHLYLCQRLPSLALWAPYASAAVCVAPSSSRKLRLLSLWIKETERLSRLSPSMRIRYCHLLSAVISFASPWQTLWDCRPQ